MPGPAKKRRPLFAAYPKDGKLNSEVFLRTGSRLKREQIRITPSVQRKSFDFRTGDHVAQLRASRLHFHGRFRYRYVSEDAPGSSTASTVTALLTSTTFSRRYILNPGTATCTL